MPSNSHSESSESAPEESALDASRTAQSEVVSRVRQRPAQSNIVGQVLGDSYRVLQHLDDGAMGTVYQAEHVRLKRPLALKMVSAELSYDEHALLRFRREAELISQLHHPHIVQIVDYDCTEDGRPYLVMERLHGRSLEDMLAVEGPLPVKMALNIAQQVLHALCAAHRLGIVHRDLKPSNVFLIGTQEKPFVKLLDFGIGRNLKASESRRVTAQFEVAGTPEYMAPEQASGQTADANEAADQYSLAVIIYEMLAGELPVTGSNVMELLQRVVAQTPTPLRQQRSEAPTHVENALSRALAKDPSERFHSMQAFASALENHESTAPFASSNPSAERSRTKTTAPPPSTVRLPRAARDELSSLLDGIRRERMMGNRTHAVRLARNVVTRTEGNPENSLRKTDSALLREVLSEVVGALETEVHSQRKVSEDLHLTPAEAFLLSRAEQRMTLEELASLSPFSQLKTLSLLAGLLLRGELIRD